jgi:hypothetical protein
VEGVLEYDQTSETVAENEYRPIRLPFPHSRKEGLEIAPVFVPAPEVGPPPRRSPVPPHVEGIDGYTSAGKMAREGGIEPAVITETVEVDQDGPRVVVRWKPCLVVET